MISLRGGGLVRQIRNGLENFRDNGDARLQTFGRAEIRERTRLQRSFLFLKNDRLGFFHRHDEVAVFFHFALRRFPPFFPVVADDVGHEHMLDLVHRRFAVKTVQHQFDQIQMMRGEMAHGFDVRGFAREDVILEWA